MTKPLGFLLTVAGLLSASEARAQHLFHRGASHRGAASPTYSYTHSATIPGPTQGSAGSGYNDFPYSGHPYGHPYDRWTWPYMSGSYSRGLARYYDPPVK
jgi:hypothetical protein